MRTITRYLISCLLGLSATSALGADFATTVQDLDARRFTDKGAAITALIESGHERTIPVLRAMRDGDLYTRKSDDLVVIKQDHPDGYAITAAASGEDLGVIGRRDVSRITVNNSLRVQLSNAIAQLSLGNPNPKVRRRAVEQMLEDLDAGAVTLLRERLPEEDDKGVAEAIRTGLALNDLDSDDAARRLAAVEFLDGDIRQVSRNRVTQIAANDPDDKVRAAAEQALTNIQGKLKAYEFGKTVFFGVSLGSVLLLAAIGLAITFGVMGVINMAHGELIMIGAYTTYLVQLAMPNAIEYSLLVAVPAAFLVSGLFGIAIERGVIRFLYGRPLETLLATFGISLILQQLVRTTISAQNVTVKTPQWMSGSWEINPAFALTFNRLYIIIFSLMVFLALLVILKRTSLGLYVRAVSQNRAMARAVGVRASWVDAATFGLGSGIAGVAGVALSQLTNVGPNLGQGYIIDSFMVVVFGGVGNLWGTLVGALTLGVANKFLEPFAGAVLAKILVLVFIILFIQKRPRGLFPQKGRAAEA